MKYKKVTAFVLQQGARTSSYNKVLAFSEVRELISELSEKAS